MKVNGEKSYNLQNPHWFVSRLLGVSHANSLNLSTICYWRKSLHCAPSLSISMNSTPFQRRQKLLLYHVLMYIKVEKLWKVGLMVKQTLWGRWWMNIWVQRRTSEHDSVAMKWRNGAAISVKKARCWLKLCCYFLSLALRFDALVSNLAAVSS